MRENLSLTLTSEKRLERRFHHFHKVEIDICEAFEVATPFDSRSIGRVDSQRIGQTGITLLDGALGIALELRRLARGRIDRCAARGTGTEIAASARLDDEVLTRVVLRAAGGRVALSRARVSTDTLGL